MVTAFTPDNISAFGSLAVVAVLYQAIGAFLAWLIREFFYVPTDFQWGTLVVSTYVQSNLRLISYSQAGAMSNWGELDVAYSLNL